MTLSSRPSGQHVAYILGKAVAWIRARTLLRDVYRCLPVGLRAPLSRRLDGAVHQKLRFRRTTNWERPIPRPSLVRQPDAAMAEKGINVFGYLNGEFGLAESARLYSRALLEAGVPVALRNIELDLPHGMRDASFADLMGEEAPHGVDLVFVNPDFLDQAMSEIGPSHMEGRMRVACWFWELPKIPQGWLPAIKDFDAILVASRFVEDAFLRVTDKPVLRVPLPLYAGNDSGLSRQDFGMHEGVFYFLCMFDFHSAVARKNPHAVIKAFKRAFPERADVGLVVKSSNGQYHGAALHELLGLANEDPRIMVRDEVLEKAHVQSLLRCCDAFVSLHRSEGFGLVMAEAMGMGKPVIATRWSGNLDFMSDDNSCLVDVHLRPVVDGEYPHEPGDVWSEPDVENAALHMRRLFEDAGYARAIGERARDDIRTQLEPSAIGRQLYNQLHAIGAGVQREMP